jgi:hypothetical protein
MVLACCTSFALGSLGTAVLIHTSAATADTARTAANVRPASFLPGLGSLPNAVQHVRVHAAAHVRAVRRRHDPKPKTPSRATISLYERTTAPRVFREQGCSAAKRGATGVIILDFGKPSYNGHTYGTILFSGVFAGNKKITRAMVNYAHGYVRCLPRGSSDRIHLARGTSNYHPSVPSVYKAGRKWARETMNLQRALRARGRGRRRAGVGSLLLADARLLPRLRGLTRRPPALQLRVARRWHRERLLERAPGVLRHRRHALRARDPGDLQPDDGA